MSASNPTYTFAQGGKEKKERADEVGAAGSGPPFENPFASTHSLDENPFDDPTPTTNTFGQSQATLDRAAELDRRERELAAREQQVREQQERISRHGKNNWPPCTLPAFESLLLSLQLTFMLAQSTL